MKEIIFFSLFIPLSILGFANNNKPLSFSAYYANEFNMAFEQYGLGADYMPISGIYAGVFAGSNFSKIVSNNYWGVTGSAYPQQLIFKTSWHVNPYFKAEYSWWYSNIKKAGETSSNPDLIGTKTIKHGHGLYFGIDFKVLLHTKIFLEIGNGKYHNFKGGIKVNINGKNK